MLAVLVSRGGTASNNDYVSLGAFSLIVFIPVNEQSATVTIADDPP